MEAQWAGQGQGQHLFRVTRMAEENELWPVERGEGGRQWRGGEGSKQCHKALPVRSTCICKIHKRHAGSTQVVARIWA